MTETVHRTVYRKEYTTPDYSVDSIDLHFELGEDSTIVTSRLAFRRKYDASLGVRPLVLNGRQAALQEVKLDGAPLDGVGLDPYQGRARIRGPRAPAKKLRARECLVG